MTTAISDSPRNTEIAPEAANRASFTRSNQAAGCAYNRSLRRHSNIADARMIMAMLLAMAHGRPRLEPPGGAALQYQERQRVGERDPGLWITPIVSDQHS